MSAAPRKPSEDNWTAEAYSASASFVPQLTSAIQTWLSPQPSDRILDIGCGDGILTSQIQPFCHSIIGYDSSPNLIAAAQRSFPHIDFQLQDCRRLEEIFVEEEFDNNNSEEKEKKKKKTKNGEGEQQQQNQQRYNKVFSNAALHWILRDRETRESVLRGVHAALVPGGKFVFEMGGAGNVADVHTALLSALSMRQGLSIEKAREASPWFFPSEEEMRKLLEAVGFVVDSSEIEYRSTRLTEEEGGGGLEGWVRLMGANFLDVLGDDEARREEVVRNVCEVLRSVIGREDGSMWLGYVRLRVLARKKGGLEGIVTM